MATAKPPRGGARPRENPVSPTPAYGPAGSAPLAGAEAPIAHEVSAYVTAQAGREQFGASVPGVGVEPAALLPETTETRPDVIERVQGYARRHPAAFFGGAFALGLGLARFFKSSARSRGRRRADRPGLRGVATRSTRMPGDAAAVTTGQGTYSSTGVGLRTSARDEPLARDAGRWPSRDSSGPSGRS
jgi:hypothetical protein